MGFLGGSVVKESACSTGDSSSVPELGRPHGEGNGYPLQYSCLENYIEEPVAYVLVDGSGHVRRNSIP